MFDGNDFSKAKPNDPVNVNEDSQGIYKWRAMSGVYLAGPFSSRTVTGGSGGNVIVVAVGGHVRLVPASLVQLTPPVPVAGETWIHKKNFGTRYIAVVAGGFVIVKHSAGQQDKKASLFVMDYLLEFYTPMK